MVLQPAEYNNAKLIVFCYLAFAIIIVFIQASAAFQPAEIRTGEAEEGEDSTEKEGALVEDTTKVDSISETPDPERAAYVYRSLTTYQVERGDSLYWIAGSYDISTDELCRLNNNLTSDVISVGQRLLVPLDHLKQYPVGVRLSAAEVEWLAQMIHAEARGEPYLGQVAVGAVIINRMLSPQFPNTLRGVLFQRNAFQPVRNGSFYLTPNESARKAALEALNGTDPTGGALYFFNPRQSTDRFMHSRSTAATIGQHRFTN